MLGHARGNLKPPLTHRHHPPPPLAAQGEVVSLRETGGDQKLQIRKHCPLPVIARRPRRRGNLKPPLSHRHPFHLPLLSKGRWFRFAKPDGIRSCKSGSTAPSCHCEAAPPPRQSQCSPAITALLRSSQWHKTPVPFCKGDWGFANSHKLISGEPLRSPAEGSCTDP